MNDDTYPEVPLEDSEPAPGWGAKVWMVCLCPVWFLLDWLFTRNWWALLTGLPALLAAGATAGILLEGKSTPNSTWLRAYDARAAAALRDKNTAAAEVYFRRMAVLDAAAPSTIYGLALTAELNEDYERARSLMRRIAPEDGQGYAPAHFWLAKDLLREDGQLEPRAQELLEHHLTRHLAAGGGKWESHALLGQLYSARGEAERAIPHLVEAARHRPDLQLMLALLYERQQDAWAARTSAEAARDFFRQQVKANPKALQARVQWAQSEALLKNHDAAVRILREGLTSDQPDLFHAALAEYYLRQYALVSRDSPDGLRQRLDLLNAALMHGPNHPQVLTALADLATQDWEGAGDALEKLEEALAQGAAPPTAHAILGTRALLRGDYENARVHLELANQLSPQMPAVLNNLAWALANQADPDLEHSLQLARAAKKLSDHPEICDTIGTILVRLGRHQEAIPELELALRGLPDRRRELHRKLAVLYEKIGDSRLEAQHRRLAEQPEPSP
jgi:tetratricopeptide (TPR) repeat protein